MDRHAGRQANRQTYEFCFLVLPHDKPDRRKRTRRKVSRLSCSTASANITAESHPCTSPQRQVVLEGKTWCGLCGSPAQHHLAQSTTRRHLTGNQACFSPGTRRVSHREPGSRLSDGQVVRVCLGLSASGGRDVLFLTPINTESRSLLQRGWYVGNPGYSTTSSACAVTGKFVH